MTTTLPARAASPRRPVHQHATTTPWRALLGQAARLVRRGTLILTLSVAAYLALKVASYLATYPDAASRARIASFDNPAVRMLQGIPDAVDTPGGFTLWDGGFAVEAVVGVWALLVTARLLRGEEESGRSELVLAGPVRPRQALLAALAVLGGASVVIGVTAGATLALARTGVEGSALFGAGLVGFTAATAGLAAVTSQLFVDRRRAVQSAAAVFVAGYLVRVVACSTDERAWLLWATPFGWIDTLHAYSTPRWAALTPLVALPLALGGAAVALRARRDSGGALVAVRERARTRLRRLGSPMAYAWRAGRGVLVSWLIGLGFYAFLIGALLESMVEFLGSDENYRRVLEQLGMDMIHPDGFVGIMASIMGVGFALYACWRIGAARAEEDSARLETVLVRPVSRVRWLAGQVLVAGLGTVLLALGCAVAVWAGALPTGTHIALSAGVSAMLATLPAAAVTLGLAVALFGVAPRLTVGLSVGLAVTAFLVQVIGPALGWPGWVVGLSPFHHLALVPAETFALAPALVLLAVGGALTVLGAVAFRRRDLVGA